MIKAGTIYKHAPALAAKCMNKEGILIERKSSINNRLSIGHVLRNALKCPCGAHNVWLRAYRVPEGAIGIICIKCNHTIIGNDTTAALLNWNETSSRGGV